MDWSETYKPYDAKRACLVVSGGAIGADDYGIQEAQRYDCHFQLIVPCDHHLARAKYRVLRDPNLCTTGRQDYFQHIHVLNDETL